MRKNVYNGLALAILQLAAFVDVFEEEFSVGLPVAVSDDIDHIENVDVTIELGFNHSLHDNTESGHEHNPDEEEPNHDGYLQKHRKPHILSLFFKILLPKIYNHYQC